MRNNSRTATNRRSLTDDPVVIVRKSAKMKAPIRNGETYSKELLRESYGIGTRTWNRLVKAGMPVYRVGNSVFQPGEVIREWLVRIAEPKLAEQGIQGEL